MGLFETLEMFNVVVGQGIFDPFNFVLLKENGMVRIKSSSVFGMSNDFDKKTQPGSCRAATLLCFDVHLGLLQTKALIKTKTIRRR